MELAVARDLRRVAWVKAFDIEPSPVSAREVEVMIDSFLEGILANSGRPLTATAAATLRLVREMTPALLEDLANTRQ